MRSNFNNFKLSALFFSCLCAAVFSSHAAAPAKVTLRADWKTGDVFQYRVNQTIKSADNDPFSTEYKVKLAVDEVTDNGSLLTVTVVAPNIEDTLIFFRKKSALSALGVVAFVLQKMPLKIRTDENGSVESLVNWKEVAALTLSTITDLKQIHKEQGSQNVLLAFETQFTTELGTRQQMFREISFLLDTYGYELTPGKELVENAERDLDKLGTIQTTEKYLLKLNAPKKGQVTINFERSVAEKQLMPLIEKILKLNNDTLTPELENEILRNLAIKDKDTTIMTGIKGVVSFVEHQREVGFAKNLLSTHLLRITLE